MEHLETTSQRYKASHMRNQRNKLNSKYWELSFSYVEIKNEKLQKLATEGEALGIITFKKTSHRKQNKAQLSTLVEVPLPEKEGAELCEIWRTKQAIVSGNFSEINYRCSKDFLFGNLTLNIDQSLGIDGENIIFQLQELSEYAYTQIFNLLDEQGYQHLLRIWNFIPEINKISQELEHYQHFNIGRRKAFLAHDRPPTTHAPAASALGCDGSALIIYFLASRESTLAIENPRQISAYHYPKKYGPSSPIFARAGWTQLGEQKLLFISGTASIVGHQSLHKNDIIAQTRESMANIASILSEANRVVNEPLYHLDHLSYKVYVRRLKDIKIIHDTMNLLVSPETPRLYLVAEICRADLLVEIEATAGLHLSETIR